MPTAKRKETPSKSASKAKKAASSTEKLSVAEQRKRAKEWSESLKSDKDGANQKSAGKSASKKRKSIAPADTDSPPAKLPKSASKSTTSTKSSSKATATGTSKSTTSSGSARKQTTSSAKAKKSPSTTSRKTSARGKAVAPPQDDEDEEDEEEEEKPVAKSAPRSRTPKKAAPKAKLFASESAAASGPVESNLEDDDMTDIRVLKGAEESEAVGLKVSMLLLTLIFSGITYCDLQMGVTVIIVAMILFVLRRVAMMLFAPRHQYTRSDGAAAAGVHDYYVNNSSGSGKTKSK